MSTRNNSGCGFLPVMGLTAIVAAGSAGAYYYFQGELPFLSRETLTPLAAAKVIPDSAFASAYVSTNKRGWEHLSRYGTPQAKQEIQNSIDKLEKEAFSDKNISFEKDIKPWIDGVTIALLPPHKTTAVPENIQPLIVIGVKNKIKADQFSKKLEKQPGFQSEIREYQNITITKASNANGDNFSFALVGDRVILAEKDYTIETAIDTFNGGSSYADKPGVKDMLTRSLTINNSLLNVYIPNYAETMKQIINNTERDIPGSTLKQLDKVESIVIGIAAEKQGLHLQATTNLNPDFIDVIPSPVSGKILSEFPGKTFVLANGQGIDKGWSKLVETSDEEKELKGIVREIRKGFKQINLDVDREVFKWMDGEFGLGIIKLERGGIVNLGVGGMMMLETSDPNTGNNTLEKLNKLAQSQGGVTINKRNISGNQVTEWTFPQQGVVFSYGWLNNQNLMVTLGTSFEIVLQEKEQQALPQNPNFQGIKSLLPSDNLGYFYVNFSEVFEQFNQFSGSPITAENQAIIESIQGLGMTVTLPNKSTSQLDLVLSIKSEN